MRTECPYCRHVVKQARNGEGPNYCPACRQLFLAPPDKRVAPWILGVVVVLMGNQQILHQHSLHDSRVSAAVSRA